VDEGRDIQNNVESAAIGAGRKEDVEELWKWAKDWIGMRVAKYALEEGGDNYTVEEREGGIENVNTGLIRKFEEDEESGEEEDEEVGEGEGGVEVDVTSARRTSTGQVEFGMGEVKGIREQAKKREGKVRRVDEILRFATSGVVVDEKVGGGR